MYYPLIKNSFHEWDKLNLVTLKDKRGSYDSVQCKRCGIKGKRYSFENVAVSETYKREDVYLCPNMTPFELPKLIKVIRCNASGKSFSNLLPESEHKVISPPEGYKNDHTGVWVMGIGEPVKLLSDEFIIVE